MKKNNREKHCLIFNLLFGLTFSWILGFITRNVPIVPTYYKSLMFILDTISIPNSKNK